MSDEDQKTSSSSRSSNWSNDRSPRTRLTAIKYMSYLILDTHLQISLTVASLFAIFCQEAVFRWYLYARPVKDLRIEKLSPRIPPLIFKRNFLRKKIPARKFWSEVLPEVNRIRPFLITLVFISESGESDQAFGSMILCTSSEFKVPKNAKSWHNGLPKFVWILLFDESLLSSGNTNSPESTESSGKDGDSNEQTSKSFESSNGKKVRNITKYTLKITKTLEQNVFGETTKK